MKKSSLSSEPLAPEICPVCEKETPASLMACQQCHAEIHHLRGRKLNDTEKKETQQLLKNIRIAHVLVTSVFILSWICIRLFLWR